MDILAPVIIAFSMFSALPMPLIEWNGRNMRYALCAFPLVGAVIGLIMGLWSLLSEALLFPALLQGAGFCLLPVLITGGIHLDGYADTSDALASRAEPERMQEILKDPHLGGFAVIRLCVYFLADFALWTSLKTYPALAFGLTFCLSRALSALALTVFPLRPGSGLARSFVAGAELRTVRVFSAVLSGLLAIGLLLCGAWPMLPAALLVFLSYGQTSRKRFGGVSGDLAGWFVQKVEFWMLFCCCMMQYGTPVLEKIL